jgi:hypothetical protein
MPDWWSLYPAWRVSRLEVQEPYGWHVLNEKTLHSIREKLKQFETMTLNQIFVVGKKNNHAIPIRDLSAAARKRLTELRMPDVEELYTLRLSAKERLWGVLTQNIISLLWWDPNHEVCPSELKNT